MGLATHKLIPVGIVVRDVPSLDTKGHNVVEKIRRIEPGLFGYEGNEDFFNKLAATSVTSQ